MVGAWVVCVFPLTVALGTMSVSATFVLLSRFLISPATKARRETKMVSPASLSASTSTVTLYLFDSPAFRVSVSV